MATKGDKSRLEPVAMRLYADGQNLTEIEAVLNVSRQTLAAWKADTRRPDDELDDWDKARRSRQDDVLRLRSLWARELTALEDMPAGTIPPASIDSLSKLGSLVKRWEEMREASRQRETAGAQFDQAKVFLQNLEWLARQLKDTDPEGLKILAANFDHLIIRFKAEHAQAA